MDLALRIFRMSLEPMGHKPLSNRTVIWLVVLTCFVLFFVALFAASVSTHEKCVKVCEDAHKHGINTSLQHCLSRCDKKFDK